jgi:hypothetical protein
MMGAGEIIAVVFIAALIAAMVYGDIRSERWWREAEEYDRAHRHCVRRPYKRPRRM